LRRHVDGRCIKRNTFEIKSLRCRGKTSGLGELHEGPALVQPEPALGDGVVGGLPSIRLAF
jgi:hypothetical protein